MIRIALVGNTQPQATRLRKLLTVPAEIILDDETRATRSAPLDVDVAVAFRFAAADIAAVRCRFLHCSAVGIDGIALDNLPRETVVCNVHGHDIPVAEYVMAGVLEHEIGLFQAETTFSSPHWGNLMRARAPHGEAAGKTLCVVGTGLIGQAVAVRAQAFGMRVVGINRSGHPAPGMDDVVSFHDLHSVLPTADYLVLACPLTDETRGLVGTAAFAAMKPTAFLINVARGEVVDEGALFEAVTAKRIAGALLDVWYVYPTATEPNPLPSRFAFETVPGVKCTPHVSAWTEGLMERRYRTIAENIGRFAVGKPLENIVWRDGHAA